MNEKQFTKLIKDAISSNDKLSIIKIVMDENRVLHSQGKASKIGLKDIKDFVDNLWGTTNYEEALWYFIHNIQATPVTISITISKTVNIRINGCTDEKSMFNQAKKQIPIVSQIADSDWFIDDLVINKD